MQFFAATLSFHFDACVQRVLAVVNSGDQEQIQAALGALNSHMLHHFKESFVRETSDLRITAMTPSIMELFDAESKEHDHRSLVLTQILSVCPIALPFALLLKSLIRLFTIEAAQSILCRSLFRFRGHCRFGVWV